MLINMSNIFGGDGEGGTFVGPSDYDLGQDANITNIQSTIAGSNVDLNPIIARLDAIESEQITQNNGISSVSSTVSGQTTTINGILATNSSQDTAIASKVSTSTFNSYTAIQDLQNDTFTTAIASKVDNSTYLTFIANQNIINNAFDTSIDDLGTNKLDVSVYNTFVGNQSTLDNTQNSRLAALEAGNITGVSQGTFNTFVANQALVDDGQNTLIASKVNTSTYNTFVSNQNGVDSAQDTLIASKVSQSAYDANKTSTDAAIASKASTAALNSFMSNQNAVDVLQDGQINTLENAVNALDTDKLDVSVYNADKALNDAALAFLNSSLNANDILTAEHDTRLDTLEARTYPQTATQTPINSIVGITGATNVQTALGQLQSNIDNIVVGGGGLSPYINTQLTFIDTPYLTNPKFTGSALKWHHINRINQDMNTDAVNGPSFLKLRLNSGNGTTGDLNTGIAFQIRGNSNGNNDSDLLRVFKNGTIESEDKLFIGGPAILQYRLSRDGLRLSTNATLGSTDGGATCNYNEAIIKLNSISQTRLTQLENQQLPTLLLNNPNQSVGAYVLNVLSSESNFYPLQITNQGKLRINHTDGSEVINMNPNEGIQIKGYGIGGVANSVVFQINAPANGEARVQLNNNGKMRLWGSTRANGGAPSLETNEAGDLSIQGNFTSGNLSTGAISAASITTFTQSLTNLTSVNATITNLTASTTSTTNLYVNGGLVVPFNVGNSIQIHNNVSAASSLIKDISIACSGIINYNSFVGASSSVLIGSDSDVRCLSASVVIGNSNVMRSASDSAVDSRIICVGSGNTSTGTSTGVRTICMGFNNEMNRATGNDDSYRICIGSGNTVRGTSSVVVGTFNNANQDNALGAVNNHFILGNNWSGITTLGLNNELRENTTFLGNGVSTGDALCVIGGNLLPVLESYASSTEVWIQFQRGFANPRGTLVRLPSARKYKTEIENYEFPIDDFMKLQTVKYIAKNGGDSCRGLIADDVYKIESLKHLVTKNGDEIEGLNYGHFTTPLISVVQQQQKEIDELKNKVNSLITTIANMMKLE